MDGEDPLAIGAACFKAGTTPPREYQMIVLNKLLRVVKQQKGAADAAVDSKATDAAEAAASASNSK